MVCDALPGLLQAAIQHLNYERQMDDQIETSDADPEMIYPDRYKRAATWTIENVLRYVGYLTNVENQHLPQYEKYVLLSRAGELDPALSETMRLRQARVERQVRWLEEKVAEAIQAGQVRVKNGDSHVFGKAGVGVPILRFSAYT